MGPISYSSSFRMRGIKGWEGLLLLLLYSGRDLISTYIYLELCNHSKLLKSRHDIRPLFSRMDAYACQIPFKNT
jgi:hypothetical protein